MTAVLQRIDYSYLDGESAKLDVMRSVIKTLSFLGLFSDEPIQESNSYLSTLSNVMQKDLNLNEHDRDLVFMRHEFELWEDFQDNQTGKKLRKRIKHNSTLVASGQSKASGGHSIMCTTVGVTCGIATRLVLEGKIAQRGVLSPIEPEIYEPILAQLADHGIKMKEEEQVIAIETISPDS
jgi:saccharopine dehydrogenase (NADP+, L-glutamate forming)